MEADPLLAPFNFPDINGMQIGLFGQSFLAHARLGAVLTECGSKYLKLLLLAGHSPLSKQEGADWNTPNMGLFWACVFADKWKHEVERHGNE